MTTSRNLLLRITTALTLAVASMVVSPVHAVSISVSDATPRGCQLSKPAIILSGRILPGDSQTLLTWLLKHREVLVQDQLSFVLDSSGGSIAEALQIAGILEELVAHVWIPPLCKNATLDESKSNRPVCASACFVLLVAAPNRTVHPASIGLHRPFFDPTSYERMDASSARLAYEEALGNLTAWLRRKAVPQHLAEAMLARSSKEIYWLTAEDEVSLGSVAPWLEEFAIARCKFTKGLFNQWNKAVQSGDKALAARLNQKMQSQADCYRALVKEQRSNWYKALGAASPQR